MNPAQTATPPSRLDTPRENRRSFLRHGLASTLGAGLAFGDGLNVRAHAQAVRGPITTILDQGDRVYLGCESRVAVLDPRTGEVHIEVQLPMSKVRRLIIDPLDSSRIVAIGGHPAEAGMLVAFDRDSLVLETPWQHQGDLWNDACLEPETHAWLVASRDGSILRIPRAIPGAVPDPSLQIEVMTLHVGSVTGLLPLPERQWLSAGADGSLRLYDSAAQQAKREYRQHSAAINAMVALTHAGNLPQCGTLGADRTFRIWQPTLGRQVRFARLPVVGDLVLPRPDSELVFIPHRDRGMTQVNWRTTAVESFELELESFPCSTIAPTADADGFWLGFGQGTAHRIGWDNLQRSQQRCQLPVLS